MNIDKTRVVITEVRKNLEQFDGMCGTAEVILAKINIICQLQLLENQIALAKSIEDIEKKVLLS